MKAEPNTFKISPTDKRKGAMDDYIVFVSPKTKKRLKLKRFAVAVHHVRNINRDLKAPCRVLIDESIEDDTVKIDQTLRTAIGIPFDYGKEKIKLYPLNLSLWQKLKDLISYRLGRRYLFFRVCKADPPDLEKNLCRIPPDAFKLLGTSPGRKIVYDSPVRENNQYKLREVTINTYELHKETIERRREEEEKNIEARYPSPSLLGVDPDVWRIFCDKHFRDQLGVDSLDAVRGRRSIRDIFMNELREFGVLFMLTLLTVIFAIFQFLPANPYWLLLGIVSAAGISVVITLSNIYSKVK
ncbi:MAG: hypothetical protein ACTSWF_12135 [Candidatus Freyarchaeota archaeon]